MLYELSRCIIEFLLAIDPGTTPDTFLARTVLEYVMSRGGLDISSSPCR